MAVHFFPFFTCFVCFLRLTLVQISTTPDTATARKDLVKNRLLYFLSQLGKHTILKRCRKNTELQFLPLFCSYFLIFVKLWRKMHYSGLHFPYICFCGGPCSSCRIPSYLQVRKHFLINVSKYYLLLYLVFTNVLIA